MRLVIDNISILDLKKDLYFVTVDFFAKLYLMFPIAGLPLLTLEIKLTICCLKISFIIKFYKKAFLKRGSSDAFLLKIILLWLVYQDLG